MPTDAVRSSSDRATRLPAAASSSTLTPTSPCGAPGDDRHVGGGNREGRALVPPTMHHRHPFRLVPLALLVIAAAACGSDGATPTDESRRGGSTTTTTDQGGTEGTDTEVEPGIEVSGDGYHGWIIDPDADDGWMFDQGAEPVWATEEEIARVEAILAEQIPERRDAEMNEYEREHLGDVAATLDDYERQYVAADDGDAHLVYVNALCATDVGGEPDRLSGGIVIVMDGGACFWNATVDLTSGEIAELMVNGDA